MKKEVGSIFPLSFQSIKEASLSDVCVDSEVILYSLCREALYDIALSLGNSNPKVLIPAYTCQTVLTAFEEAGWSCSLFNIKKDLRIDTNDLTIKAVSQSPSLLVVHPYYGMDLNKEEIDAIYAVKQQGVKIIVDLTQCLFSDQELDFVDYYVGSYRKWYAIPDGGFLKNRSGIGILQPQEEYEEFVSRELDAMYLRGLYFQNEEQRTKDISIKLSKSADHTAETNISPHRMSRYSCYLKSHYNLQDIQQKRTTNFTFLFQRIVKNKHVQPICEDIHSLTTAPLYYTIYVSDRAKLQKLLALESIYAPVIWPVEDAKVLINDNIKYIYDHLLAIPCDQRYDTNDMQRIVNIVNDYSNQ